MIVSDIEFLDLDKPSHEQWLELLNNKRIKKHMPLAENTVDLNWVLGWLRHKKELSAKSLFPIYSIWINSGFAGWAGIQPDDDDFELSIVLKPEYWGYGRNITKRLVDEFLSKETKRDLLVYLPISRGVEKIAAKLQLEKLEKFELLGKEFMKFRANKGLFTLD